MNNLSFDPVMAHGGDVYGNKVDIDFSVNLNPFGTPDEIRAAIREGALRCDRYPDPMQRDIRRAVAKSDGVDMDKVIAGSGASELIMAVVRFIHPREVTLIEPCFAGYRHALLSLGDCAISEIYLRADNGFGVSDDIIYDAMGGDMLFLTDPWNPTGRSLDDDMLIRVFDEAADRGLKVLLDESFYLLSDKARDKRRSDAEHLTDRYTNLFIIRSYTKVCSVPGIRVGYVVTSPENTAGIKSMLPEWNLSSVSEAVGIACAEYLRTDGDDGAESHYDIKKIMDYISAEREYLARGLTNLGIEVYDSDAVYMMIRSHEGLYRRLLDRHILIRDLSAHAGLGEGFARIAVRTHEDNEKLLRAIMDSL